MKTLFVAILICSSVVSKASDLTVSTPLLYIEEDVPYAVFNLSWDHAWHNERNHDGVWLFFKSLFPEGGYQHIRVMPKGHSVISNFSGGGSFEVPTDAAGMFFFPPIASKGNVDVTIKVMLDRTSFDGVNTRSTGFKAYAIEMVKIPQGSFQLGSSDEDALPFGGVYKPGQNGNFAGPVTISSEDQELNIAVDGDLYYEAPTKYEGDQTGIIPSSYPKGVSPFYIMKYEPTEGMYVDFLNTLGQNQVESRLIFKEDNYYQQGGTISDSDNGYVTPHPDKPCLFMTWNDAMAYADWAGLRPMTEFEFTKAARGISKPTSNEFPWGDDDKEKIQRLPTSDRRLVMSNGWDESKRSDDTKAYFGASYYWVMDLAGSMWERVITIGHPNGRNFIGSNGDGILSSTGSANNENWPVGKENSGGIGFRGGGFYGYDRAYHKFNPFSPIAYRRYGGWHGGMGNNAYGTRFVRSSQN